MDAVGRLSARGTWDRHSIVNLAAEQQSAAMLVSEVLDNLFQVSTARNPYNRSTPHVRSRTDASRRRLAFQYLSKRWKYAAMKLSGNKVRLLELWWKSLVKAPFICVANGVLRSCQVGWNRRT